MRIESRDRDPGRGEAAVPHRLIGEAQAAHDIVEGDDGATLPIGTCEVTRAFHSFGRMLNSLAAPWKSSISAVKTISSS